jgi:cathepsin A (carboxypeptidase C)
LRITSESHRAAHPAICDPDVKQISGYLDISETKHLFFWFFESRSSPSEDPLVLWLNGGPGCSSTTGLLFELGPCQVAKEGKDAKVNVTDNQYSWTNKANVIFLDQPVGVGYSYSDDEQVNNSPAAAEDVYAFLTLFIGKVSTSIIMRIYPAQRF